MKRASSVVGRWARSTISPLGSGSPPLRPTTHTYLTTAEVAAFTLACGRLGDVVTLLAYTQMRFGELTGLNVEDVDLNAPDPRA